MSRGLVNLYFDILAFIYHLFFFFFFVNILHHEKMFFWLMLWATGFSFCWFPQRDGPEISSKDVYILFEIPLKSIKCISTKIVLFCRWVFILYVAEIMAIQDNLCWNPLAQSICTHYSCFGNMGRFVTLKKYQVDQIN